MVFVFGAFFLLDDAGPVRAPNCNLRLAELAFILLKRACQVDAGVVAAGTANVVVDVAAADAVPRTAAAPVGSDARGTMEKLPPADPKVSSVVAVFEAEECTGVVESDG